MKDAIDLPFQQNIGFLQWAKIGTPTALILLPIAWWLLSKVIYKVDKIPLDHSANSLHAQRHSLGKMHYEEIAVCWVFVFTIVLWLSRTFLQGLELTISGNTYTPLAGLTDSSIAIFSAILLFLIPAKSNNNNFILEWKDLRDLPWGI